MTACIRCDSPAFPNMTAFGRGVRVAKDKLFFLKAVVIYRVVGRRLNSSKMSTRLFREVSTKMLQNVRRATMEMRPMQRRHRE